MIKRIASLVIGINESPHPPVRNHCLEMILGSMRDAKPFLLESPTARYPHECLAELRKLRRREDFYALIRLMNGARSYTMVSYADFVRGKAETEQDAALTNLYYKSFAAL